MSDKNDKFAEQKAKVVQAPPGVRGIAAYYDVSKKGGDKVTRAMNEGAEQEKGGMIPERRPFGDAAAYIWNSRPSHMQ